MDMINTDAEKAVLCFCRAFSRKQKLDEMDRLLMLYRKQYIDEKNPNKKRELDKKIKDIEDRIEKYCLNNQEV